MKSGVFQPLKFKIAECLMDEFKQQISNYIENQMVTSFRQQKNTPTYYNTSNHFSFFCQKTSNSLPSYHHEKTFRK